MNARMYELGSKRSVIREIFEFGKKRAAEVGADKVFDFSLGNPSVNPPQIVEDTLRELLQTEDMTALHGYTSAQGDAETRRAIAEYIAGRHGVKTDPDYIYMTCGAAASLTYENRNLFRGAETFSVKLRGAFEAITGLEGYQNQDYEEYSLEARLVFPRFVVPFLSREFRRRSTAVSELSASYNLQNRPEFHRRVFTAAWRYLWDDVSGKRSYKFDLLDLNYIYMPWISSTFREEYLDDVSNRNSILRYNYEDLFIMKMGFGMSFNNGIDAYKVNVETSGNLLSGISRAIGGKRNADGQYTLFNIAYAQYVKGDFDVSKSFRFDDRNSLALHFGMGVAYPYGNSTVLPYEKRYFSGGANSVRGWSVRELGPGRFTGGDGRIDFINQTGDIKLDLSAEYRTFLFWKLHGAVFVDAGNIWTIRNYAEQPGGQFRLNSFWKEIAVSYGLGFRLNFDYFILRLDGGMKAVNPAYTDARRHFPIIHPDFGRDFTLHFAVGLPF